MLDFEILWMSSQPIDQWNYIIFSYSRFLFKQLFAPVFGKECIMRKKFKFTRFVYFDRWYTNKVWQYTERVYFIDGFFIFFISTFSFLLFLYRVSFSFLLFLYAVSLRYKKNYLHPSMDISFYIMFYIINTTKINIWQLYTTFVLKIHKRSRFDHGPLVHCL